jgi:hypothetical protein
VEVISVKPIVVTEVQPILETFVDKTVYLHLETTNGAYAASGITTESKAMAICAFIRNTQVQFDRALLTGSGPFRAGLEITGGWVYAEGLTDWEVDEHGHLLLAGHDDAGRLAITLELSLTPFRIA